MVDEAVLRTIKRFTATPQSMKHFAAQNMKRSLDRLHVFFALFALKKGKKMVVGDGFEPSNSSRADLQSAAFDRSAIPPREVERVTGVEPV